jgi:glycine dehydrogenase subunit 1
MLAVIGVDSIDELFAHIPPELRAAKMPDLPGPMSEEEVSRAMSALASKNADTEKRLCFLGMGAYDHHIPAVVDAMASRGEFFTAYTPYQPEISQGGLQAIFEYQTMMASLAGLDVSNASLYDGATAIYEAVIMATRAAKRDRVVVCGAVNPLRRSALEAYARNLDLVLTHVPHLAGRTDEGAVRSVLDDRTVAVVVQYPNVFGAVQDFTDLARAAHERGALLIVDAYPIALGLLKSPGAMGADIACGEAQSLGIPLQFGGPYLGYLACRKERVRLLPGRLVGRTTDAAGKPGFVLTLQTREQHIRRAKATSNICSNEALMALRACVFLTCLGPAGLREMALLNHQKAEYCKKALSAVPGCSLCFDAPTFNEFALRLPRPAKEAAARLADRGIAAGAPLGEWFPGLDRVLLVAVTERRTREDIDLFARELAGVLRGP